MRNDYLTDKATLGNQITVRCAKLGVPVSEVCRLAGVAQYHVTRWKNREPAGMRNLRKIEAVLEDLEKSREASGHAVQNPKA